MTFQDLFPVPPDGPGGAVEELTVGIGRWAEREVLARRSELPDDLDALLRPAHRALIEEVGLGQLVPALASERSSREALATAVAGALQQVGRADLSLAFVASNLIALQVAAGREGVPVSARRRLLDHPPSLVSLVLPRNGHGAVPAFAGLAPPVEVTRKRQRYLLDGARARPQCAGREAELFAVVCALRGEVPALLLLPGDVDGLSRLERRLTTGLAYPGHADLRFEGVSLTRSAVLFEGEEPYRALQSWYALCCAASAVGASASAWAILDDWSRNRVIKGRGQPFKDNGLVASVLGEIGERLASARLLVAGTARLLDTGRAGTPAVHATVVSAACNSAAQVMQALDRAMELMGSAGYAREWVLESQWRDVRSLQSLALPRADARLQMARHAFGSEVQ